MTEQEARTKWCPQARTVSDTKDKTTTNRLVNRGPDNIDTDCLCLASKCMLWRANPKWDEKSEATGYCGLGGKG